MQLILGLPTIQNTLALPICLHRQNISLWWIILIWQRWRATT